MTQTTTIDAFLDVEIRVGRVIRAEEFPRARKPAYKLWVDFGELGVRQASAQITDLYTVDELKCWSTRIVRYRSDSGCSDPLRNAAYR